MWISSATLRFSGSGTGKTPSYNHGCLNPVYGGVETYHPNKSIIIDQTTENGIFNTCINDIESVPILVIDEAFGFMDKVVRRRKGHVNIQMLCRLYDGAWWSITRGPKMERARIPNAKVSTLLFRTPELFLEKFWKKVVDNEDGMDDRFLINSL